MKLTRHFRPLRLFPFALLVAVALADKSRAAARPFAVDDSAARSWWGVEQAPAPSAGLFGELAQLKSPADVEVIIRREVRREVRDFKHDLNGVREGDPESLVKVAFTGARLAGVDAGGLTAAKFAYHYLMRDPLAYQPTLGEILPERISQAPDRTVRHVMKSTIRHGFSGDLSSVLAGDVRGQALELVPATLHSLRLFFTAPARAELPAKEQS